jgi:hypothetical protein
MDRRLSILALVMLVTVFTLSMASVVGAEDVGNFTQVVKKVDLSKGGTPPAQQAKVGSGVAIKDLVETRAESHARMQFVDDTTMIVAPQSKVTIEDYMVDRKTGKTRAAVGLLQGLVRTVVPEKVGNENFLIKTSTSTMGIRG